MKKEKINLIDSIKSLSFIVIELLEKIGLQNIKRLSDEIIYAEEHSSLKTREIYFFITLSELSGKVVTFKELIVSVTKKIDNAYIITSHKKLSTYFEDWIKKETKIPNFDFWNRDTLIDSIDKYMPEYWEHDDIFLNKYEKNFLDFLTMEGDLKKILRLDDKFDKLLNIFIEPKIHIYKEDKETKHPVIPHGVRICAKD